MSEANGTFRRRAAAAAEHNIMKATNNHLLVALFFLRFAALTEKVTFVRSGCLRGYVFAVLGRFRSRVDKISATYVI